MASEWELIERLREFLRSSDLNTTTTAIVRRKLEEDFGIDLSDKKAFIREQVDLFLHSQLQGEDHPEEEEEGAGDLDDDRAAEVKSEKIDGSESTEEEEEEQVLESINGKGKRRSSDNPMSITAVDRHRYPDYLSKKHPNDEKKRGGGFSKICSLSPQLQKFIGVSEMARTEVVKQMWIYIREKSLQDPNDKRNIICDEPLRNLFGVDSINMFQMNKALSKHIWSLDSDSVNQSQSREKEKQRRQVREESDEPNRKEKRQKGGNSGFLAPLRLSDSLVNFLGTGESALPRAEVIKRMWDYIKQNNLQDPSDKRRIICDEKLKELFDVDSFTGFTVSKLLAAHFIKAD